jgi:hypothetical protein
MCPDAVSGARRYYPLHSEPALFQVFANTEPTEEGIISFADRYGSLGCTTWMEIPSDGAQPLLDVGICLQKRGESFSGKGEKISQWTKAIYLMRASVRLWNLLRKSDTEELRKHFHVRKNIRSGYGDVLYRTDGTPAPQKTLLDWNITTFFVSVLLPGPPDLNLYDLAKDFLIRTVNTPLNLHVSPFLERTEQGEVRLRFAPKNLLGALWLQLAQAIAGGSEYRPCPQCRRLFEISRVAGRTDKVYCSNACRVQAFRFRRERARELHAQGKKPAEIATEIGTEVNQVKKWLQKKG